MTAHLRTGRPLIRYRPSGLVPAGYVCNDTPVTGANVLNTASEQFAATGHLYLPREGDAFGAGAWVFGTDNPDANAANEDIYTSYGAPLPDPASEELRSQCAWIYGLSVSQEFAPRLTSVNPVVDTHHVRHTVGREAGPLSYRTWAATQPSFEPVGVIDCASSYPYAAAVTSGMELDFSVEMRTDIPHIAGNNISWYLYDAGVPSFPADTGPVESFSVGSSYSTFTSSWTAPADGFVRIVIALIDDGVGLGDTWDLADPTLAVA